MKRVKCGQVNRKHGPVVTVVMSQKNEVGQEQFFRRSTCVKCGAWLGDEPVS